MAIKITDAFFGYEKSLVLNGINATIPEGSMCDEIQIKQDLVFKNNTGELVGFQNLNHFRNRVKEVDAENQGRTNDIENVVPLANHIFQFMVRGLTTDFRYALLGPSGCGKTTLLRALCKTIRLKNGKVDYQYPECDSRRIPGNGIGFMPQESALLDLLSVEENLDLFASLNGVKWKGVENTLNLLNMLELHEEKYGKKIVGNLSGGEKRRLSLVIALMHDPLVIVLDEPTVGVDPLLRISIWNHLKHLATKRGKTIIITTHYIDEAKDANFMAFMRNGRIVAESSTKELTKHYKDITLESCYTKLFQEDENNMNLKPLLSLSPNQLTLNKSNYIDDSRVSIANKVIVFALILKNWRVSKRNAVFVLFNVVSPAVQIMLFCLVVGSPMFDLPISIFNEETPKALSTRYLEQLTTSSNVLITLQEPIYGRFDVTFTEFIMPNAAVSTIFSIGVISTAITLVMEKKSGVLERIMITGATRTHLLLAHFLCQLALAPVQIALVILPIVVFEITIQGSFILCLFSLFLMFICAMTFGLLLSSFCESIHGLMNLLNFTFFSALLFSGFLWPLEGMPYLLRYASYFLPLTLQMESLRCIISRGWGIEHQAVWLGLFSSFVWIIIFLFISILIFKRKKYSVK